eukprot:6177150-Pleurochrysis_carterae.AAC.3
MSRYAGSTRSDPESSATEPAGRDREIGREIGREVGRDVGREAGKEAGKDVGGQSAKGSPRDSLKGRSARESHGRDEGRDSAAKMRHRPVAIVMLSSRPLIGGFMRLLESLMPLLEQ